MIDAKQAAQAAVRYLEEVSTPGLLRKPKDVRLEEIESDDNPPVWRITLSFVHDRLPGDVDSTEAIRNLALAPRNMFTERYYKTFEVLAGDGTVRAMKMRAVNASR